MRRSAPEAASSAFGGALLLFFRSKYPALHSRAAHVRWSMVHWVRCGGDGGGGGGLKAGVLGNSTSTSHKRPVVPPRLVHESTLFLHASPPLYTHNEREVNNQSSRTNTHAHTIIEPRESVNRCNIKHHFIKKLVNARPNLITQAS